MNLDQLEKALEQYLFSGGQPVPECSRTNLLEQLQCQLAQYAAENGHLKNCLASISGEKQALESELANCDQENKVLVAEHVALKNRLAQLHGQNQFLQCAVNGYEAKVEIDQAASTMEIQKLDDLATTAQMKVLRLQANFAKEKADREIRHAIAYIKSLKYVIHVAAERKDVVEHLQGVCQSFETYKTNLERYVQRCEEMHGCMFAQLLKNGLVDNFNMPLLIQRPPQDHPPTMEHWLTFLEQNLTRQMWKIAKNNNNVEEGDSLEPPCDKKTNSQD